jgi:hypothetical protein
MEPDGQERQILGGVRSVDTRAIFQSRTSITSLRQWEAWTNFMVTTSEMMEDKILHRRFSEKTDIC